MINLSSHYWSSFEASQEMKRLHFILFWLTVAYMNKVSDTPMDAMTGAHADAPASLETAVPRCKPAGRPRASDLEARHQNLIHTAGELFLRHGYGNVSLETIAREAHVAVRTIYVKFGGKPGLLKAAIDANRAKFYTIQDMETDTRPLPAILLDFGYHFYDMITAPVAVALQRMVIAEGQSSPELAETFFNAGPRQTRDNLAQFFSGPAIRAQLRDDVDINLLPAFLLNCVLGDQFFRFLFDDTTGVPGEVRATVPKRVDLFLRAVLRQG
jgi:TetR/AcrR family transcriptional repressor of mexJK operon